jgi:YegS/Rv2252/BmrU family lipid kinase
MNQPRTLLIVNPIASGGRTGRLWPGIQARMAAVGLPFDHRFTAGPGDAIRLARQAVEHGYELVVAVGGDGTINEVVNGLMLAGDGQKAGAELGLIMTGRGSDFGRTVGVPADPGEVAARLAEPRRATIDVGLVEYHQGATSYRRYFVNVGGGGFDGEVAVRANRSPRFMGGTVPYLSSLVISLVTYRNKPIELTLDQGKPQHLKVNAVVVANGQYFGGGMRVAPDADPNDGLFDVVIVGDMGKIEFLRATPSVYEGTHVNHPKVSVFRAREVSVRSAQPLLLQVDGEVCGHSPLHFELIPQALSVRV